VNRGCNGFDATLLYATVVLGYFDVLGYQVDAVNNYTVLLAVNRQHCAGLAAVAAALLLGTGDDNYGVTLFDGRHD